MTLNLNNLRTAAAASTRDSENHCSTPPCIIWSQLRDSIRNSFPSIIQLKRPFIYQFSGLILESSNCTLSSIIICSKSAALHFAGCFHFSEILRSAVSSSVSLFSVITTTISASSVSILFQTCPHLTEDKTELPQTPPAPRQSPPWCGPPWPAWCQPWPAPAAQWWHRRVWELTWRMSPISWTWMVKVSASINSTQQNKLSNTDPHCFQLYVIVTLQHYT